MSRLTIIGTGSYLPGKPITNVDLARVMDTSDEWIRQRTGIVARHYAQEGEGVSDLGYEAAKKALAAAKVDASEIDYVILASMTPENVYPGSATFLSARLGITGVPALDIRVQCAAMPFSFQIADGLVSSGAAKTILVVGADVHAPLMPWEDWDVLYGESDRPVSKELYDRATRHRAVSVLFGDGAGALVMRESPKPGHGLIGAQIHTDGRLAKQIYVPNGMFKFQRRPFCSPKTYADESWLPQMNGKELFKSAVQKLPKTVRELCAKHNVKIEEIDWFIAHQANDRINFAIRDALEIPHEKVPSNIANYGNTSGATIPILLDELIRDGKVKEGQLLCFLALGSGLHWGATLMRL